MTDTMAQSYLHNTSRTAGAATETAADKKTAKYAPLIDVKNVFYVFYSGHVFFYFANVFYFKNVH